jgi:hypothetical protein
MNPNKEPSPHVYKSDYNNYESYTNEGYINGDVDRTNIDSSTFMMSKVVKISFVNSMEIERQNKFMTNSSELSSVIFASFVPTHIFFSYLGFQLEQLIKFYYHLNILLNPKMSSSSLRVWSISFLQMRYTSLQLVVLRISTKTKLFIIYVIYTKPAKIHG